jgi:hypothetical protein
MTRAVLLCLWPSIAALACDGRLAFDTHWTGGGGTGAIAGEAGAGGASDEPGGSAGAAGHDDPCPAEHECVACSSTEDCTDLYHERWCDLELRRCVECRDAQDCPPNHVCNASTRRCH